MTYQTIVAVYETAAQAAAAVSDLQAANILPDAIGQHTKTYSTSGTASNPSPSPLRNQGFWASLFGSTPDHDTSLYDRSIESGSSVLTVRVPDEGVDRVTAILEARTTRSIWTSTLLSVPLRTSAQHRLRRNLLARMMTPSDWPRRAWRSASGRSVAIPPVSAVMS